MAVAVRILKDRYGVFIEPVDGRPYYVRFRHLQSDRTIQGMTHQKGTRLHPLFILQILERFEITIPDFLEAIASVKKGPQAI